MEDAYRYENVDGHLILLDGESRSLIDTGAPESAATNGEICIGGTGYPVGSSYLNVTPELLGECIGTEIDALIGVDILNQYDVRIDSRSSTIKVCDGELPLEGQPLEHGQFMGIPILDVGVASGGAPVRVFFDTGARLSYLEPSLARQFPAAAREQDFYPGLGRFTTQTHQATLTIGTERVSLVAGILPTELTPLLEKASTSGILGTAILETHGVCYAPRRGSMSLWRLADAG